MIDPVAFFRDAVPLHAEKRASSDVLYLWSYGAIFLAKAEGGEVSFSIVEAESEEMDRLLRGAGADRVLSVYSQEVR